jgi:hypothetical protein
MLITLYVITAQLLMFNIEFKTRTNWTMQKHQHHDQHVSHALLLLLLLLLLL